MRYSSERREAVLRKMLPPHNKSIPELAREEGISEATLYNYINSGDTLRNYLYNDVRNIPNGC